jgi:lysophospholipase
LLGANPAPLLALESDPPPAGAAAEWVVGAGGARLRAALCPAQGRARGSVVLSPGRTEPIEKYFEVARRLTGQGFTVLVHDWRGQGLSHRALADRRLGHADGYQDFLTDFRALLDAFSARLPQPWLAMGHSMGGCLTLLALAEGERRFAGAFLSAPMLGIKTGGVPRPLARVLAWSMSGLGQGGASVPPPPGPDPAPFESNILTHDRARYERNLALVAATPDLALGPPTWGWLKFAFQATDRLAKGAGTARITVPVSVLIAGEDALVDNDAAIRTAARLPQGGTSVIAGAHHELFQETHETQALVWQAFAQLADCIAP